MNRFDEKNYDNGAPCVIGLFDKELINDTCIEISEGLLSRLIYLGQAYELHLIPLFDIYNDTYLNYQQCDNLLQELDFIEHVTNDRLIHNQIQNISKIATDCIRRRNCQLLISGN